MGRRRKEEERSMDSLMDALTNVVGILLLILIISSLSMSEAIKIVVENLPEVTEEELEEMRVNLDERRKEFESLRATFTKQEEVKKDVDQMRSQIVAEIEEFEKENADLIEQTSDLEELKKKIEEQEEDKKVNDEKVLVASRRVAELQAILDQMPALEVAEAEVVRMPNPRRSGDRAEAHYIVCHKGKLFYVGNPYDHAFLVRDALDLNFNNLVYDTPGSLGSYTYPIYTTRKAENGSRLPVRMTVRADDRRFKDLPMMSRKIVEWNTVYKDVSATVAQRLFGSDRRRDLAVSEFRLDPAKVKQFFGEAAPAPQPYVGLLYHIVPSGDRLRMSFSFDEEAGLSVEQFKRRDSLLDRALRNISGRPENIVYFYVDAESFRVYLAARDMVEFYRLPAGWTTFAEPPLVLKPTYRRESTRMRVQMPGDDYLALAAKLGPAMLDAVAKERSAFAANLSQVKIPEKIAADPAAKEKFLRDLEAERKEFIRRRYQPYARSIFEAGVVAGESRGMSEEVWIDVHPPEILYSRLFTPARLPTAPPPPPDPNRKPAPSRPTPSGTSVILD